MFQVISKLGKKGNLLGAKKEHLYFSGNAFLPKGSILLPKRLKNNLMQMISNNIPLRLHLFCCYVLVYVIVLMKIQRELSQPSPGREKLRWECSLTFIFPAPVKSKLGIFVESHTPNFRNILGFRGQQSEPIATSSWWNLKKSSHRALTDMWYQVFSAIYDRLFTQSKNTYY